MSDAVAFVLGGARSGKTRHALALAEAAAAAAGAVPTMIATAQAFDDEMAERIALHRAERGDRWRTVEAPVALADAVRATASPGAVVVVDCLTLWLTNLMLADADVRRAADGLEAALRTAAGPVVLVSNEVGLGIVPENALARRFRDEQGRLNQRVAALAGYAAFLAAGIPLALKRPAAGPFA
jgi:adenosylcobinamide kinase/adenosylcobinamide-phosphate guanylyltransferase